MIINELYKAFKSCTGVCTDTRKLEKGNIFFSLKGENFNGNEYARQALDSGAKYCVVDEPAYNFNEKFILVKDVLTSLQELAKYHRTKLGLEIIALTGSNGKTTTKELINAVLSKKYKIVATDGNLNNHIGVPLTLLQMNENTEIGIVEMGANHLKEIEFLCNIAQPNYGLITNFGKAHLEGFGSEANIIKGKSELYKYLVENDQTIIANTSDGKQMDLIRSYYGNEIKIGEDEEENLKLISTQPFLTMDLHGSQLTSKLTGKYNFNNILYAVAIGEHFKVAKNNIIDAIEAYIPDNNRSQIIEKRSNKIILDAYNANPTSMVAAIDNFSEIVHPRKIAVLGDMFELGSDAEKEHQAIADYSLESGIDEILLVGVNFYKVKNESSKTRKFKTFEELKDHFINEKYSDSHLLIKGSRGMALERILEYI